MSTALKEHQFELLPTMDAETGVRFGIGADVSMDEDGFVPGSTDWVDQDTSSPTSGATGFGRDVMTGPTWNFGLHTDMEDVEGAVEALSAIRTAWHWRRLRNTPGAVTALRYRVGGRTRRIYGRPRRFDAPPTNLIISGMVPISCDFKCVDANIYDDIEQSVTIALGRGFENPSGDSGGGFVFPLIFPVVTLPPKIQHSQLVVEGTAPAYPVVRFNGPVLNPSLETDDWTLSLDYDIPSGSYVEIDTRPWRLTALLDGTGSVAGRLGRRQRLNKVVLQPGRFDARFRGLATNGTPTCQIRWASAWDSI